MAIFSLFFIVKKIYFEFYRIIVGKKRLHARIYGFSIRYLPKKLPKTLWIYWNQGIEFAPPLVQHSIESWQRKNPTWAIHVLSDATIRDFVELPTPISERKIQAKSDLLRLRLLKRYGGVWVDATAFCVRPLDDWLPPLMQSGFFAFPETHPDRVVQNWFLAAAEDCYLIAKWEQLVAKYYTKKKKIRDYFWVMYLFEFMIRTDRRAAKIWAFTPKVSEKGTHLLKRLISRAKYAEKIPGTIDETAITVLKISSTNQSNDPDFLAALHDRTDIPLRKMADNLINRQS